MTGMWLTRLWSDDWDCQLDREWVAAICSALVREDTPPARAIYVYVMGWKSKCDPLARGCMSVFVYVMGRKSKCNPLARGCMSALLANGLTWPFQCTCGNGNRVPCTRGNGNRV